MPTSLSTPLAESGDPSLRAGRLVFGRYRLEKMVGRGGMGVVWRAFDTKLERIVALKFLPDIFFMDIAARDDLKRETRRSLELTHPHIVRIHDFVDDEAAAAISMEYVDGANLSQRRVEQPTRFFECEALHGWTQALCQALDYAHHTACCVHRDLKPSNLMITARGILKVADFGISCGLQHTAARVSVLTSTGGTLGYMSPQQAAGELAAPSDDIYSFGATLYELLTSKPPFYSGDLNFQIRAVAPDSIAARRGKLGLAGRPIDPCWEETIAACLAKEPSERPAEMLEIAQRLGLGGAPTVCKVESLPTIVQRSTSPRPAPAIERWLQAVPSRLAKYRQAGTTALRSLKPWIMQYRRPLAATGVMLALVAVWFRPHHQAPPIAVPPAPSPAAQATSAALPVQPPPVPVVQTVAPYPEDREYLTSPAPPSVIEAAPAIAPPDPAAPEPTARLQIATVPPGIAFRVLRGAYETAAPEVLASGFTPALLESLPTGACRVEMAATGLGECAFSTRLSANEVTHLDRDFPHGMVKLQSTPAGAEIFCDDQLLGTAPLEAAVLPGAHSFRAEKGDAESRPQTLTVTVDGKQTLTFDFHTATASVPRRTRTRTQKPEPSTFTKIGRSISGLFGGGSSPKVRH